MAQSGAKRADGAVGVADQAGDGAVGRFNHGEDRFDVLYSRLSE